MNAEQLKRLCGVCGEEHFYSEAICEESLACCGACGQFYPKNQSDFEGFHSADYCEVAWEEMNRKEEN